MISYYLLTVAIPWNTFNKSNIEIMVKHQNAANYGQEIIGFDVSTREMSLFSAFDDDMQYENSIIILRL